MDTVVEKPVSTHPSAEVEEPALSSVNSRTIDTEVEKPVSTHPSAEVEEPALSIVNRAIDTVVEKPVSLPATIREVVLKSKPVEQLTPIISVNFNKKKLDIVVDTAAQVSVINQTIFEKFCHQNTKFEIVQLKGAGTNHFMKGKFVKRQNIQIGSKTYNIDVYVAPISDDMILGADFLISKKAIVDFNSNSFKINNESVPIKIICDHQGHEIKVSQVKVLKHMCVAPNAVTYVKAKVDFEEGKEVIFEPVILSNELMIPRTVLKSNSVIFLPVTNLTDSYKTLKKDKIIGSITEIDNTLMENDAIAQDQLDVRGLTIDHTFDDIKSTEELTKVLPIHIQDLFKRSSINLNLEQATEVATTLLEYSDIFAKNDTDLGKFDGVKHKIDTENAKPIRQHMRRTPLGFENEEEKHLNQMLDMGVVRESNSEWASPPVLVRKKDGTVRWCIDYRALNNVTVKDAFPLPQISECIDSLADGTLWSTLDLQSGYWQIELDSDEDMAKTAFITKYGLFEHTRLPFGLCNSPATFQRAIQLILRGLSWKIVCAYLDDVVILGKDFSSHIQNLRLVFERFRKYKLKLKPRKCSLFQTEITFLGRKINAEGVHILEEDKNKVINWPTPSNNKELQKFLGYVNYHRSFIQNYANFSGILYDLVNVTKDREFKEKWSKKHKQSFENLKKLLTSAPCLAIPNNKDVFILDCDASLFAIGGALYQIQHGKERLISFDSYVLSPSQRNYCATRRELLAVIRFLRKFRHYLLGRHFFVRTDHSSLAWLLRFKNINGQLARWLEEISEYNLTILHRPGSKHLNADALVPYP